MAAPGEFFPKQFATSILQLAQNVKQRNAELAEMRSARAARNFIDKERLNLQRQQLGAQFMSEQAQAEAVKGRNEIALAQTQVQAQEAAAKERLAQQDRVQKALVDFQDRGFAVLPEYAASRVSELLGGKGEILQRNLPGVGTIVTRMTGDQAPLAAKAKAELARVQSTIALQDAKRESYLALRDLRARRTSQLARGLKPGQSAAIGNTFIAMRKSLQAVRNSKSRELEGLRLTSAFQAQADPTTQARITKLEKELQAADLDLTSLATDKDKQLYAELQDAFLAAVSRDAQALQTGINPLEITDSPDSPGVDMDLARSLGLDNAISQTPATLAKRFVPDAPWRALPVNAQLTLGDRNLQFYQDNAGFIPLNQDAWQESLRNPTFRNRLHPQAGVLGWTPKTAGQPGRSERPAVPAPEPVSAGPDPGAPSRETQASRLQTEIQSLAAQLQTASPDERRVIVQRLRALRDEVAQLTQ